MNKLIEIVIFVLIGVALGFIYFGGLWLTVRKFLFYRRSFLLVLLSFLVRNGLLLFALYLIGRGGEWDNIIFALIGIIGARWIFFGKINPEKSARPVFLREDK
ncbi:MAG: ATP synthase subunit I [Candidatus Aminicenantes bacterium]|nr:ATP synthase subunit I [Candidatus Aminicenantes bacterium]